MRTISEICESYLILLKKEGKVKLTYDEIREASNSKAHQKIIRENIDNELGCGPNPLESSYELHNGQKISSVRAFMIYCKVIVHSDLGSGKKVWRNFLKMQFELIEKHKLIMYLAARSHGKSFFANLYISFKMYLVPYFDVLMGFNIPIMIENFFLVFMRTIDNNEMLISKKEKNRKNLIWGIKKCGYNKGVIKSTTLGSTGRSSQVSLAWLDDLLSEASVSKFPPEKIRKFVLGDIFKTIGQKKGRLVVEGTVFSDDDIYHQIALDKDGKYQREKMLCTNKDVFISARKFACRIFPGVLNHKTKEVLVPEVYTYDELMNEKEIMGDYNFYREIQQICKVDKSALMSYYLFMKCTDEKLSLMETGERGKKYVMVVDPSAGEGQYSDYAAITIIEKVGNKKIIRFLWQERFLPIIDPDGGNIDLTHKVIDVFRDFHSPELWIENNSIGRVLIQNLRKEGLDPNEHSTDKDKIKIMLDSISDFKLENKIIIPYNKECDYTMEWVDILKKQALSYGLTKKSNGKIIIGGKGSHDDLIMSCLLCIHYTNDEEMEIPNAICI